MDDNTRITAAADVLAAAAERSRTPYDWAGPVTLEAPEADALRNLYGGPEVVENEFPLFAAALERSVGVETAAPAEGEPRSYVTVRDVEATGDFLAAAADVSLNLVPARLVVSIIIRKNGEVVGEQHRVLAQEAAYSGTLSVDAAPVTEADLIDALVVAAWDNGEGLLSTCIDRSETCTLAADPVAAVRMAHPVLRYPNPTPDPIAAGSPAFDLAWPTEKVSAHDSTNVCFLRQPRSELIDYLYPEERKAGSPQPMMLDIRGEVTLVPPRVFKGFKSASICLTLPTPEPGQAGGGVPYLAHLDDSYFQTESGVFRFAFPTHWESTIEESTVAGNRAYDIDIGVAFLTDTGEASLSITSKEAAPIPGAQPSPHYSRIPQVRLFWGCLDAASRVLMADGSLQRIDAIQPGDCVAGPQGAARVIDVISGREPELIHLETESGEVLLATADHPVLVGGGMKRADEVLIGDAVCTSFDGATSAIRYHFPAEGPFDVRNLVLEQDVSFLAEGFVVGDNNEQERLVGERRATALANEMPSGLQEEIERMRALLEG